VPEDPQQKTVILETSSSTAAPDYWRNLVIELVKRSPPIPPKGLSKHDDLADRVAKCICRTYDGKYDPVELKEWIRGMEKIFAVVEVPRHLLFKMSS